MTEMTQLGLLGATIQGMCPGLSHVAYGHSGPRGGSRWTLVTAAP